MSAMPLGSARPEAVRIGVTDVGQLIGGGRRGGGRVALDRDGKLGRVANLLRCDPGMQAGDADATGGEVEDAQRGDQGGGAAPAPSREVPRRGDVVNPLAKAPRLVLHDQHRTPRQLCDVSSSAAPVKPHLLAASPGTFVDEVSQSIYHIT